MFCLSSLFPASWRVSRRLRAGPGVFSHLFCVSPTRKLSGHLQSRPAFLGARVLPLPSSLAGQRAGRSQELVLEDKSVRLGFEVFEI